MEVNRDGHERLPRGATPEGCGRGRRLRGSLLRRGDRDDDGEEEPRHEGAVLRKGHHQPPPRPRGFTVERLAGAIADLPPAVPRESAVLIVRKTLDAAGVRLSEVDESTREQEARLSSEIGLAEDRQEELREKTQETVRSL